MVSILPSSFEHRYPYHKVLTGTWLPGEEPNLNLQLPWELGGSQVT